MLCETDSETDGEALELWLTDSLTDCETDADRLALTL